MIPRQIFFVGRIQEAIDPLFEDRCRRANPEWEVERIDVCPDDMPDEIASAIKSAIPEVQREVWKAWLLFSRGGVACDPDVWFVSSADPLVDLSKTTESFISCRKDFKTVTNAVVGSVPGSAIMADILSEVTTIRWNPPSPRVFWQAFEDRLGRIPWFKIHPFRSATNARNYIEADYYGERASLPQQVDLIGTSQKVIAVSPEGAIPDFSDHLRLQKAAERSGGDHEDPQLEASIMQMAATASSALLKAGMNFVSGRRVVVDADELNRRMTICRGAEPHLACEFYMREQERCAKCGCFTKYKARLMSESCPLGKW